MATLLHKPEFLGPNDTATVAFIRFSRTVEEVREQIEEFNNYSRIILYEDKATRRFAHSTIRKEGRNASRKGWYNQHNKLHCQVISYGPEYPFRLMLGGANK